MTPEVSPKCLPAGKQEASLRVFIAVELPASIQQEVAALQASLRATGADVKWVEPQNLHLTLKFLGNVEETRIAPLIEALRAATLPHAPCTLHLEGIGAFPNIRSPRVIWVGVSQGQPPLTALAQAVEQACVGLGFPAQERPFSAHLTIGRIRSRDRLAHLIKQLQVAEFCASHPAPADHLTLFQSVLSPKGPTYTPLAKIPLGTMQAGRD